MGCVLQKNALISNLTAYDNCALALRYFKITDERGIRARVMQVLQRLHVADAAHLLPERLSYGQARRVALARACVPAPDLLIIDELFAGVDEYSRDTLHTYITTYAQKYACTVIMGTKNRTVADTLPWTRFTIEQGRVVF
jgi:ABC-type sulfate/molybdate transport systems ATPase subunit